MRRSDGAVAPFEEDQRDERREFALLKSVEVAHCEHCERSSAFSNTAFSGYTAR